MSEADFGRTTAPNDDRHFELKQNIKNPYDESLKITFRRVRIEYGVHTSTGGPI